MLINIQNMFLNVVGHLLLPVLALLIGNSCPEFIFQYCGHAQMELKTWDKTLHKHLNLIFDLLLVAKKGRLLPM